MGLFFLSAVVYAQPATWIPFAPLPAALFHSTVMFNTTRSVMEAVAQARSSVTATQAELGDSVTLLGLAEEQMVNLTRAHESSANSNGNSDEVEMARLIAVADLLRATGSYIAASGALLQATGFATNARVSLARWQKLLNTTSVFP